MRGMDLYSAPELEPSIMSYCDFHISANLGDYCATGVYFYPEMELH